jgi:hypothetical protein
MTARHVLPAITVFDSTKGTPKEVTIYQPKVKTHLAALAMNKRESKKTRRTQVKEMRTNQVIELESSRFDTTLEIRTICTGYES